jgi:hypothetical protein
MRNRTAAILSGASIAFAGGLVFLSGNGGPATVPSPAGASTFVDTETAIRPPRTTTTAVSTMSVPVTVVRTSGAQVQVLPAQRIEVTRAVTLPPVTVTATAQPVPTTTEQETSLTPTTTDVPMP